MTLRRRLAILSLVVALPSALLILTAVEWVRARDLRLALTRVVRAHATEVIRDACEADPRWFLAGPRTGRPSLADRLQEDADIKLPRPSADELPLEVFAYDDEFLATSTAGPRFPREFRDAMRGSPVVPTMYGTYGSELGTGQQIGQLTGWSPGPCAVLLFRMQPRPGIWRERVMAFGGLTLVIFAACLLTITPTVARIRRLSQAAGESSRQNYETIAPDAAKDEVSALAYVFNDASTEIHQRRAEVADRIEALRRFTAAIDHDISEPLAAVEAAAAKIASGPGATDESHAMFERTHDVLMRLRNLAAANHLRQQNDSLPVAPADLARIVTTVVERHRPLAAAKGMSIHAAVPGEPLMVNVHETLTAEAIANVLDNAIRYSSTGSVVSVALEARGDERFSLTIANPSPARPMPDEEFAGLTKIRRFRGDEGWNRRPNAPGLGLAVAREIADRSGLGLSLARTDGGGLEAVFTGGHTPTRG